jgi:hypothetical protein
MIPRHRAAWATVIVSALPGLGWPCSADDEAATARAAMNREHVDQLARTLARLTTWRRYGGPR